MAQNEENERENEVLVNENDSEIMYAVREQSNARKYYQKYTFWIVLLIILLVVVAIGVSVMFSLSSNKNKSQAVQEVGYVLEKVANGSNVTDYMDELKSSFDTFDANNDGAWDIDELSNYLQATMSSEDIFHIMDVNGDNILSFREVTAILLTLDSIPVASELIVKHFSLVITSIYNYSYSSGDVLWFSYAADLFFNFYDSQYTGYITFDSYYDMKADKIMQYADVDKDHVITFNEFISDTFSNLKK
eukprot:409184_1